MLKAMIQCNGVPTEVITYGRWVEEGLASDGNNHVIIVLPGNPGVPAFYEEFSKVIKSKLPSETPVWILGYAGHVQPPDNLAFSMPNLKSNISLFDLRGQLDHKAEFIKKYVPKDAKLHLIGHSIGSWFILNLLRDEEIAKQIVKCYLLFPTVEHMKDTPNGRFLTKTILPMSKVLVFLSWIFMFFPLFIQFFLIKVAGIFCNIPNECIKAMMQLLQPESLKRVFMLAKQEMLCIEEADHDLISQYEKKLYFYYSKKDGWTPISYYANMKSYHPNAEIELCKYNMKHSFVLSDSKKMGEIIGSLIVSTIT